MMAMMGAVAILSLVLSLASGVRSFSPAGDIATLRMSSSAPHSLGRRSFVTNIASSVGVAVGAGGWVSGAQAATYKNEYLTESTAETKELEAKQAAFKKKMQAYKAEWSALEGKLVDATTDEEAAKALSALRSTLVARQNLPEGRKSADLFKVVKRKKAEFQDKGLWGTPVEIEYEGLIRDVNLSKRPDAGSGYQQL